MSQKGLLKRYSLIINKVQECYFPKLPEIIDYLSRNGCDISERTIQRDLEQLGLEFGLHISYSRAKKGYYIAEENKIQLAPFLNFLEIVDTAEIITASLAESHETLKYISFDKAEQVKGHEFLKPLLKALREHKNVAFEYQTFTKTEKTRIEVFPYLLKQYMGRWYLIACYINGSKLYLFGLDRILSLEIAAEGFKPDPKTDPRQKFRQMIGISDSNEPPQKVLLSFNPNTAPYIKSLPLHHTQKITVENGRECRVELYIKINRELISNILSFVPAVKVLKPAALAAEIKQAFIEGTSLYKE